MLARALIAVFVLAVAGVLGFVLLSEDDVSQSAEAIPSAAPRAAGTSGQLRPDGSSGTPPRGGGTRTSETPPPTTEAKPAERVVPKLGDAAAYGRVRERATGAGVAEADVFLASLEGRRFTQLRATTAKDGSFTIEGAPEGDALVCVSIAGTRLLVARRRVTLAREQRLNVGDLEAIQGSTIRGRAIESETGAPVAGASIVAFQPEFEDAGDHGRHLATADASGLFELPGPFGPGAVVLSAAGRGRKTRAPFPSVQVPAGVDIPDIVVSLARAQDLRGQVFDEDRHGIPAQIEVAGQGRRLCCTDTESDGSFVIADVVGSVGLARPTSTTELQVKIHTTTHRLATRIVQLIELDAAAPLEFRVERGASIAGRCVDGAGSPLASVRVHAYPTTADRHARERETMSRADGAFAFEGLEAGAFAIEAEPTSTSAPRERSSVVQLEATTQFAGLEVVFAQGLPIAGDASTDEHVPLGGRIVTLHHAEWLKPRVARTQDDGTFRFEHVPEGTYTLALRGKDLRERRVPVVRRDIAAGTLDNRFVVHEEPADGRIELRLSDALDGAPVTVMARVEFVFAAHGFPQDEVIERRPDSSGVIEFTELERTEYSLVVNAPGFAPATFACSLDEAHREETLYARLERPVPLLGLVIDAGGLPIQDARVKAFRELLPGVFLQTSGAPTDSGGRFHLDDAPKDAGVVCAIAPGFAAGFATLDANTKLFGVRILLKPGARIEGYARFSDGVPAPDIVLQLDGAIARQFANTDADGRFTLEDVEDGGFVLSLPDGEELGRGTISEAQGIVVDVDVPAVEDV